MVFVKNMCWRTFHVQERVKHNGVGRSTSAPKVKPHMARPTARLLGAAESKRASNWPSYDLFGHNNYAERLVQSRWLAGVQAPHLHRWLES